MKVAILTVNFNGENKCLKLVKSLENSTFKNYKVFIVDNGSEKSNFVKLKKLMGQYKNIKIIRSEKNLGWGLGCNLGLKNILGEKIDYTFVVNNDTKIDSKCLACCIETMENNKKIGICGIKTLYEDGQLQTVGGKINLISKLTGILFQNKGRVKEKNPVILDKNEFVDDCGWMIRSKSEKEIVWYPDYLFMYSEELYINKEMLKRGRLIAFDPRAKMYHSNMGSSGGSGNAFTNFYVLRNRYIFIKDYYLFYFPIVFLTHTFFVLPVMILKYALKKRWDLIKSSILGVYSAFVYLILKKRVFFMKVDGKLRLVNTDS